MAHEWSTFEDYHAIALKSFVGSYDHRKCFLQNACTNCNDVIRGKDIAKNSLIIIIMIIIIMTFERIPTN